MNHIGAYFTNEGFHINILGLQGVEPVGSSSFNDRNGGVLKLVENTYNKHNDTIIIRYNIPPISGPHEGTGGMLVSKEGTGALLEKEGFSKSIYEDPQWSAQLNSSVLSTWIDNWLAEGEHIHILKGSVDPGWGSKHISFGQHAFRRGLHYGYSALKPNTKPDDLGEDTTYGYYRPQGQTGYTESDRLEPARGTDLHMGGEEVNINGWSTGCIVIWGGNSERYWLFMLTAYMHGYPQKVEDIPVTVWRGVDYFKWKRMGTASREDFPLEHQFLPELHFGTRDPEQAGVGNWQYNMKMGWVERMQRILWEGMGRGKALPIGGIQRPSGEPSWGVFDKNTVGLVRSFQRQLIDNLDPKTPALERYYRFGYQSSQCPIFSHEWDEKERRVRAQLSREMQEAICGPATWEAMKILFYSDYFSYTNDKLGVYEINRRARELTSPRSPPPDVTDMR